MNTQYYPGSGPSWRGKPLHPALGCIALLGEVTVQGELVELEVFTMATTPLAKEEESNRLE